MIKRLFISLILSVAFLSAVVGQNQENTNTFQSAHSRKDSVSLNNSKGWALTYSPSALINSFIGVQFGVEKCLAPNKFLELESAYIFKQAGNAELYKYGYRVKLGYKMRSKNNFLLSGTLYLRNTIHQHREEVIIANQFIQELEFRKTKTLIGPAIGLGYSDYITERIGIEASLLGGLGIYLVKVNGLPVNATEAWTGWFLGYTNPGRYYYPIVGVSFKLKYKLGGKD